MKRITFYLDFISPYAYLAFEHLPQALSGISYSVAYRPVLFAGLLKHHGQLGPAEIAAKRDWTYRQVMWLAHRLSIPMQMPVSHPFNPLPMLRLAIACQTDVTGESNRYACETVFRHVWQGGGEAADLNLFDKLLALLPPTVNIDGPDVKNSLKNNTEHAIAHGVFGVPAFGVDDKVFWGLDALPMLRDYLLQAPWFQNGGWKDAVRVGAGISRQKS